MPFVIAHAGHWAVNLLYVAPLAVFVAALARQKLRERRERDATGHASADAPVGNSAERPADRSEPR